jgi:hypothetical protein
MVRGGLGSLPLRARRAHPTLRGGRPLKAFATADAPDARGRLRGRPARGRAGVPAPARRSRSRGTPPPRSRSDRCRPAPPDRFVESAGGFVGQHPHDRRRGPDRAQVVGERPHERAPEAAAPVGTPQADRANLPAGPHVRRSGAAAPDEADDPVGPGVGHERRLVVARRQAVRPSLGPLGELPGQLLQVGGVHDAPVGGLPDRDADVGQRARVGGGRPADPDLRPRRPPTAGRPDPTRDRQSAYSVKYGGQGSGSAADKRPTNGRASATHDGPRNPTGRRARCI